MKRPEASRVRLSRVVLVGLPGAGKTTVGQQLAERLGFDAVDPDAVIAHREGLDIAAIFRDRGEAAFRILEREAVLESVGRERVVVTPGGGWAAQPGAMEELPAGTAVVWLQVSIVEAARRLERADIARPLLAGADLAERLAALEGERMLAYSAAGLAVETDGRTPEEVTDRIVAHLEAEYGIDGEAY